MSTIQNEIIDQVRFCSFFEIRTLISFPRLSHFTSVRVDSVHVTERSVRLVTPEVTSVRCFQVA